MLLALQSIKPLIGNPFFTRLNEGGPLFMYTTLILLIVIIALLIRGFLKKEARQKTITLVSSISLFVLVWGFLGQMLGLITAFDAIEAAGDISPSMLAGGLKIAILSPLFGMVVFLIARIGIIILNVLKK
tara:strand:+ start:6171 stop:6560 length:390 start_codon:yes stop_codon:yes gene_type:complete